MLTGNWEDELKKYSDGNPDIKTKVYNYMASIFKNANKWKQLKFTRGKGVTGNLVHYIAWSKEVNNLPDQERNELITAIYVNNCVNDLADNGEPLKHDATWQKHVDETGGIYFTGHGIAIGHGNTNTARSIEFAKELISNYITDSQGNIIFNVNGISALGMDWTKNNTNNTNNLSQVDKKKLLEEIGGSGNALKNNLIENIRLSDQDKSAIANNGGMTFDGSNKKDISGGKKHTRTKKRIKKNNKRKKTKGKKTRRKKTKGKKTRRH